MSTGELAGDVVVGAAVLDAPPRSDATVQAAAGLIELIPSGCDLTLVGVVRVNAPQPVGGQQTAILAEHQRGRDKGEPGPWHGKLGARFRRPYGFDSDLPC